MSRSSLAATLLSAVMTMGCAAEVQRTTGDVDVASLPRESPEASEVILLQSNVNCDFLVDGRVLVTGQRMRGLVTRKPHKITCRPEGYSPKDEYVQPPFDARHAIGFTFLPEDRIGARPPDLPRPPEPPRPERQAGSLHRSYGEVAQALAAELAKSGDLGAVHAIVGFQVPGSRRKVSLSSVLVNELQILLVQAGFQVVERARLDAVLEDLARGQEDVFEEKSAAKIGRLLGATRLIVGTIVDDPATGTVRVSAQLMEVETARVFRAARADLIRNATVVDLLSK